MRICFITSGLGFGGAEKMLVFVANQLSTRGHLCTIINLNKVPEYTNLYQRKIEQNIRVLCISETPQGKNRNIFCVSQIKDILIQNVVDVIIGFTEYPNLYAKIVGTILGIPSIMSERGDPTRKEVSGLRNRISKYIVNHSTGGVFQTAGAQSFYSKRLQSRSIIIPNPIFVTEELPDVSFKDRSKTVVSVGRLDNEQKRYDIMLKAFNVFSQKHPDYILKLYGKGADEGLIRQWIDEFKLSEKVRFMGLTTQPMTDIAHDGMFLITSDYEGISNSLLEAMAVGIPCVSTDHTPGGARLLIQDHINGLLAPVQDVEKLADAMCEYADNSDLAMICGNNAKGVLERFAPKRIIDMWESYILRIVESK